MRRWFRFFLGTPRRFLATFVALVVMAIVTHVWPGALETAVDRLVRELMPVIGAVLAILIVLYALRHILGLGGRGGGGRR